MRLIIDIPDNDYEHIKEYYEKNDTVEATYSYIYHGIPLKQGHWINVNEGKWNTIPAYKCSECGANADLRDWSGESPFCPWCGAKMEESEDIKNE